MVIGTFLDVLNDICSIAIAILNSLLPASFIRFDAIVSADAFEKLKPAPDIFLAASKILNVPVSEVRIIFSIAFYFLLRDYC